MSKPRAEAPAHQLKLLLIGDSAIGKTSLLLRYMDDRFSQSFVSTIGIDFKVKLLELDGQKVRLQIWDTAGQERFRTITTSYFRGAHGILLCFDMTDRKSFLSVEGWTKQIAEHCASASGGGPDSVALLLVGTKSDMADKLQVSEAEGQALAAQHKMRFFATSAKFNSNVKECFDALARAALAASLAAEGGAGAGAARKAAEGTVRPGAEDAGAGSAGKGCGAC
jgi:small GTP-binding protein